MGDFRQFGLDQGLPAWNHPLTCSQLSPSTGCTVIDSNRKKFGTGPGAGLGIFRKSWRALLAHTDSQTADCDSPCLTTTNLNLETLATKQTNPQIPCEFALQHLPSPPQTLKQSFKMDAGKVPVKLVKVTRVLGRTGNAQPQLRRSKARNNRLIAGIP